MRPISATARTFPAIDDESANSTIPLVVDTVTLCLGTQSSQKEPTYVGLTRVVVRVHPTTRAYQNTVGAPER